MTLAWNIDVTMATLMWLVFLLGGISLIPDSCTACLFGSSADCVFRCHCARNAACDVTTGQCPGQCGGGSPQPSDDVTGFDWRGPACQIGNVALGKSAEQSGVWGGLVAGNAVDGILGDVGNANCAFPEADSGALAWLRVDLGSIHVIHNVTVFNTHDGGVAVRMEEFEIGVGNTTDPTGHTLCARHGSPAVAAGGDVTINCNSPLYGRYVSFRRAGGQQPHLVTICEFVVMGYKQTYATCSNCASDVCDDILGCMECSPSYSNVPICDEGCAAGFYGDGCSSTCGSCGDSSPCRYTDGTCPDGCQQWYTGDKCDLFIDERVLSASYNPSTAIASSSTSIDVKWESEEGIPDSLVSYYGYVVQYGLSGSDDKATSNDVPHQAHQSHHSVTIRGLQPAITYDFQVFIYRKQNNFQEVGVWGSNRVTATTLGREIPSTAAQVTTKTSTRTATPPITTTHAPTTTKTASTTTTTTQTTTATISSLSSSSTPTDMTTSTLSGSQDCQKQNDQQKTIVALGVINVLLVIVIIVGLLERFLHRRHINQQSKTGTTSYGNDYENVAMSSSPDNLTASDQARSAGSADMNVPSQNDTPISSINEADHSGKEQPYETLNNFQEVKGEYSRLNTRPTN